MRTRSPLHELAEDRFINRVEVRANTTCWHWDGNHNVKGYAKFTIPAALGGPRQVLAHRFAYEIFSGPIPHGLQLDHICRNPGCVNPSHLQPVTLVENVLRGLSVPAVNARKTRCKRGHDLTGDNVYEWRGHRLCQSCRRAHRAERWQREKAAA